IRGRNLLVRRSSDHLLLGDGHASQAGHLDLGVAVGGLGGGVAQHVGARLKMDLEWLKNSPDLPIERRRLLIDREEEKLSVRRQCELLGVGRSGLYYCAAGENAEKVALMRKLDEQYTRTPYYGVRRMTAWLQREGWEVNPKRVRRLLRVMGLEAIYPKPKLSQPEEGRRVYPYLLRAWPLSVWITCGARTSLISGWRAAGYIWWR